MHSGFVIGFVALLGLAPAVQAQDPSVTFNLFTLENAYINHTYSFNAAYTAKYNIPIEVPFVLQVPIRKDVELIADGHPDGGIVKFTFVTKGAEGRNFIEHIHVVDAVFPIPQSSENPMSARLQVAARLLAESAYPSAVQGRADAKMIGTREISVNGMRAAEVLATYSDPVNGPIVLQLTAIPHPLRAESYFTSRNISRTLVPMTGPEQLPETLGGRVLDSFTYE